MMDHPLPWNDLYKANKNFVSVIVSITVMLQN